MNELLVVFFVLATITFAYLFVYPKYCGENVKLMAWLDVAFTTVPIGLAALVFWESNPVFRFIFFDTNWFFFTVLTILIIELPVLWFYLRARGLSFWAYALQGSKKSADEAWALASTKSVEKQLSDTKWDGLRTPAAKRSLLWGSNLVIAFGTGFLLFVGDNLWASYLLIHILLLFVSWFLLRQSVRLVADAPEEALDERMIRQRDRSYLVAFRWLAAIAVVLVQLLVFFAIFTDFQSGSDGFNYQIAFTWPQVQAIFWLVLGYALMLPSMAMLSLELQKTQKAKRKKK